MSATLLNIVAIIFYFISWIMITLAVRADINNKENPPNKSKLYFITWFIALIIHIVALHYPLMIGKPLVVGFATLGSYVMWFISLILFITTLKRKIQTLVIIILPFTIISIIISLMLNTGSIAINMKSGLGAHILTSLLAYSLLMLASFQALLLAIQNNHLHNRQNTGFIRTLPSLEDMEHILFRFISIGVIMLSLGLLTGFYYLDNLFGSNIAHKTILSIISWLIFSALLLGRWKYGWRGKKAIRWTIIGFITLALAFFGTKFVHEFILDSDPTQSSIVTPTIITLVKAYN
ncbi:MAG: cytochrome c biogenesis protein CcsA [Cocleimonas sp.]